MPFALHSRRDALSFGRSGELHRFGDELIELSGSYFEDLLA